MKSPSSLRKPDDQVAPLSADASETITREIQVDDKYIHQTLVRVASSDLVRLYGVDVTERKRAQDRLAHRSLSDELTGLPNRAMFIDRLGRALGRARRHGDYNFAVLFIDLREMDNVASFPFFQCFKTGRHCRLGEMNFAATNSFGYGIIRCRYFIVWLQSFILQKASGDGH